ncbi:hypothetical protein FRB99_008135 [Tulasnella sp. 403]|nr:hypothetical protein FRB99_008135 [Tulasnella sp. 403]
MLRALEFYSGIGGLHVALTRSQHDAQVVAAYDWDPSACQVYEANFGPKIVKPTDISKLTAAELARHHADLWLLSPSCQPYTVLNPNAKGEDDPRAASFLHLVRNVIPELHRDFRDDAPRRILVENVAGFESSTTRTTLVRTLHSLGYAIEEFLLSPTQFGIPNSRLRYYLLARLSETPQEATLQPVLRQIPSTFHDQDPPPPLRPISDYLDPPIDHTPGLSHPNSVPRHILEKWGRLFDIVKPGDRRSCCFTRSYTKMVEGTGSILQQNEELETSDVFDAYAKAVKDKSSNDPFATLEPLRLRYFTPSELLRLFHFVPPPETPPLTDGTHSKPPQDWRPSIDEFKWPASISLKTKYRLIGNSVNVKVVTCLVTHLLGEGASPAGSQSQASDM